MQLLMRVLGTARDGMGLGMGVAGVEKKDGGGGGRGKCIVAGVSWRLVIEWNGTEWKYISV